MSKDNKLTIAERNKMFEILVDTCEKYGIEMSSVEDAENFWEVLRYGETVTESKRDKLFIDVLHKKGILFSDALKPAWDEYHSLIQKDYLKKEPVGMDGLTKKVLINTCYGGFSLSYEVYKAYFTQKYGGFYVYEFNFEERAYIKIPGPINNDNFNLLIHYSPEDLGDKFKYKEGNKYPFIRIEGTPEEREDPLLIDIVSRLGGRANTIISHLKIIEVPSYLQYDIYSDDGIEWLVEKRHTYN